jgi:hypothetical protein
MLSSSKGHSTSNLSHQDLSADASGSASSCESKKSNLNANTSVHSTTDTMTSGGEMRDVRKISDTGLTREHVVSAMHNVTTDR